MRIAVLSFLSLAFIVGSAYFVYVGLTMDTTLPAESPSYGTRVANLQLMQIQSLDLQIGMALALIAAILFAAAFVVAAVEGRTAE